MKNQLEYRTLGFEVRDLSGDEGIFSGYASAFNRLIPGYYEKVLPGAFKRTLDHTGGRVPVLWQHTETVGVGLEAHEDKVGLKVKGQMAIHDVQRAREGWALMAMFKDAGVNFGLSIGFRSIKEDTEKDKEGNTIRLLKELQLVEYSPTPFPANPGAKVTGQREASGLADGVAREIVVEALATVLGRRADAYGERLGDATRDELTAIVTALLAPGREPTAGPASGAAHELLSALRDINQRLRHGGVN